MMQKSPEQSLIETLNLKLKKHVFKLFWLLIFVSASFHLSWSYLSTKTREKEIKNSIIQSVQEPLRRKALIDIKNIILGHGLTNSKVTICLKLKDGTSLTDGNCSNVEYEEARVPLLDDYFYISVKERFPWEMSMSYLALFFIGAIVFNWTQRNLNLISKSIISDLDAIVKRNYQHHFNYVELKEVEDKVQEGILAIEKSQKLKRKSELGQLATRLAHDIREPLTTIKKLGEVLVDSSDENKARIFKQSINHAEDLINNLLCEYRGMSKDEAKEKEDFVRIDVVQVIQDCISSFKLTHDNPNIEINLYGLNSILKDCRVGLSGSDIHRVITNAMKNSYEAIDNQTGKIDIRLNKQSNNIRISIKDNGPGILPSQIDKILTEGFISQKSNGNGIGLKISKSIIESVGGKLKLKSDFGKGTEVLLELPLTSQPEWCLGELNLSGYKDIVIFDDESINYDLWKLRLENILKDQKMHYCASEQELKSILKSLRFDSTLFLVDYYIEGERTQGIGFIKEYGLASNAILVTSAWGEEKVVQGCIGLGVKLLPKGDILKIDIHNMPKNKPKLVLVDDGVITREYWKEMGREDGVNFDVYSDYDELFAKLGTYSTKDVFFCDWKIKNKIVGEKATKQLAEKGFANLYMQTGCPESLNGQQLTWLKKIIGKDYPHDIMKRYL